MNDDVILSIVKLPGRLVGHVAFSGVRIEDEYAPWSVGPGIHLLWLVVWLTHQLLLILPALMLSIRSRGVGPYHDAIRSDVELSNSPGVIRLFARIRW